MKKPKGIIHYAKLANSERLQRVLAYLKDYFPHSTFSIIRNVQVCAVNSIIAELRMNGFDISYERKGIN